MSEFINPFVAANVDYKRKINLVGDYIENQALFISMMRDRPIEACRLWVTKSMERGGSNELKDPKTEILQQRKRGNRKVEVTTFLNFIEETTASNFLLSPSLAAYRRPEDVESKLGKFTTYNVEQRNVFKHRMKEAKQDGNKDEEETNDSLQASTKEGNNSLSGAFASAANPLFNQSSHSALTSTCRSATSYANASNERFLAGNRHYHNVNVTMQELINAERLSPKKAIKYAFDNLGIKVPTVLDVFECVTKSSKKYWSNRKDLASVLAFIEKMSLEGRAAIVYTGDLYQIAKLNPEYTRDFIQSISKPAERTDKPHLMFGDVLSKADSDITALVTLLCSEYTAGKKVFATKETEPHIYYTVNATAVNVMNWLNKYEKFIDAFLRPRYAQSSIAEFPSIIREAVVTSDTDSTIFTTQMWTNWITGSYNFEPESYSVGYSITYIASQITANALGLLCGNLGIGKDLVRTLAMKNEYYFPGYKLTKIAKHYIQMRSAQEGNVYAKMELDVKGVNLRSSKAPKEITEELHAWFVELITKPMNDEMYTVESIMEWPMRVEKRVRSNIVSGGVKYLPSEQIKDAASYTAGESSPQYRHYKLWDEVFAPKYGYVDEAPVSTFKICVQLDKKTSFNKWLDEMEDRQLAERFKAFAARNNLDSMTSFQLPQVIAVTKGIPKEIMDVIDIRRATMLIMAPYYLILESYGIFIANSKHTRLMTDYLQDSGELDVLEMSSEADDPDEMGSTMQDIVTIVYGFDEEDEGDD